MEELKEQLDAIMLDCIEHHGYHDEDEVAVYLTIKQVKELLELLR